MKRLILLLTIIVCIVCSAATYIPVDLDDNNIDSNIVYTTNDATATVKELLKVKLSETGEPDFDWATGIIASDSNLRKVKMGECKLADAEEIVGLWYINNVHEYNQNGSVMCNLFNPPKSVREDCSGYAFAVLAFYMNSEYCVNLAGTGMGNGTDCFEDNLNTISGATEHLEKVIPRNYRDLQNADIMIMRLNDTGHAEILVKKISNNVNNTFGWGNVHTTFPSRTNYKITEENGRIYTDSGTKYKKPLMYVIREKVGTN